MKIGNPNKKHLNAIKSSGSSFVQFYVEWIIGFLFFCLKWSTCYISDVTVYVSSLFAFNSWSGQFICIMVNMFMSSIYSQINHKSVRTYTLNDWRIYCVCACEKGKSESTKDCYFPFRIKNKLHMYVVQRMRSVVVFTEIIVMRSKSSDLIAKKLCAWFINLLIVSHDIMCQMNISINLMRFFKCMCVV